MNYKETLFFVAQSLTLSKNEKNRLKIEKQLKEEKINWDNVVKVSTAHYVFPALYLNLKKVDFLKYVPNDLVEYMLYITNLNRERNQQIIEQAKELNSVLLQKNIIPIFLKGVSYLQEGLYDDIAERMVGDIDFIVSKENYLKSVEVLKNDGYKTVLETDYHFPEFKHYPRLNKENNIAAVEVHKELLIEKFASEFNYETIKNSCFTINNFLMLDYSNQLNLSIIAKQINDNGVLYKTISLKNSYDVFLLSNKIDTIDAIQKFEKLYTPLNSYLALCNYVFKVPSIAYKSGKKATAYLNEFEKNINAKNKEKIDRKLEIYTSLKIKFQVILKALKDKTHRKWLFKRIIYGRAKKS